MLCSRRYGSTIVRKVHLEKRQTTWHECTTTIVSLRYVNPFKRGLNSMQDPTIVTKVASLQEAHGQLSRQFSGPFTQCSIWQ